MELQIKEVNYGVSNYYGTYIEINKDLKNYPRLYEYVLSHEKGHKDSEDLLHEFNFIKPLKKIDTNKSPNNPLYNLWMLLGLLWFCIIHPSTWIDLSPIQYRNKEFIFDNNLAILYVIIFVLIIAIKLMF
jgi:hypothetical protein